MMFAFALDAIDDWRKPLLRLDFFHDNRCALKALLRLTFPVPVRLNRFFDELCDFNLGIFPSDIDYFS